MTEGKSKMQQKTLRKLDIIQFYERHKPHSGLNRFTLVWHDGYPSGVNYWSDYADVDAHSDQSKSFDSRICHNGTRAAVVKQGRSGTAVSLMDWKGEKAFYIEHAS